MPFTSTRGDDHQIPVRQGGNRRPAVVAVGFVRGNGALIQNLPFEGGIFRKKRRLGKHRGGGNRGGGLKERSACWGHGLPPVSN